LTEKELLGGEAASTDLIKDYPGFKECSMLKPYGLGYIDNVEYLIGYESNAFALTGNVEEELLSINAVHPMWEEAVGRLFERANTDWSIIQKLIAQALIVKTKYGEKPFM